MGDAVRISLFYYIEILGSDYEDIFCFFGLR